MTYLNYLTNGTIVLFFMLFFLHLLKVVKDYLYIILAGILCFVLYHYCGLSSLKVFLFIMSLALTGAGLSIFQQARQNNYLSGKKIETIHNAFSGLFYAIVLLILL